MVATESPKRKSDRDLLWETWENLELPPGSRAEILRGAIYLSPTPVPRHNRLYAKLSKQLITVTEDLGWEIINTQTVLLPATDEAAIPDLLVVPDEAIDNAEEWRLPPDEVRLAAEITSPPTRERDRSFKLDSYAKAGIPIYLVIDPLESDGTVTVYHRPDRSGAYRLHQTVEFGTELALPKPFGKLDTAEFKSRQPKG